MQMSEALDATFQALADPTRRAILTRLAAGDASVGELAEPFAISMPAISRHLKVLESAELISRHKDAQWRRCHLRPEKLKPAADWISEYRKFWDNQFDALAHYLQNIRKSEEEKDDRRPSKRSGNDK